MECGYKQLVSKFTNIMISLILKIIIKYLI